MPPYKRAYVVLDNDDSGNYEEQVHDDTPLDPKELRSSSQKPEKKPKVSNMILFTAEVRCGIG